MLDLHESFEEFYVLLFGDFNSRTADKNVDFSLSDDVDCTDDLRKSIQRKSQDVEINQFGEKLLDFCNIFDCLILNGLTKCGFDDGCTIISDFGSSLVDYFISSFDLLYKFSCSSLLVTDMVNSDHLPVALSLWLQSDNNRVRSIHRTASNKVPVV